MPRTIRYVTAAALDAGPVCVAYNAAKLTVECGGPPDSFTGDNCTCIDSDTGESYLVRIRNGM